MIAVNLAKPYAVANAVNVISLCINKPNDRVEIYPPFPPCGVAHESTNIDSSGCRFRQMINFFLHALMQSHIFNSKRENFEISIKLLQSIS